MPDRAPPAATIVARNYLPAARVLADSYREHHGGAEFTVLVVDADGGELDGLAELAPGVRILGPADLDLDGDEFGRMAMAYSVTELCTAVKPWLLRRLLAEHPVAIYLDPDIEVFGAFGRQVAELAAAHDIVLTPHVTRPMPRDGLRPSEADIMASGVFNLGFIGVSSAAEPFLRFWADRLRTDAISSVTEQLFTDQRWVDNVPALFRHTVIDDPGYNVAFWNVYQRRLARGPDGRITADGAPLRFYHYSGYRPEKPWLASTHYADKPRVLLSERPLLAELFTGYRRKLIAAGYAAALDDVPYRWNTLADGSRVSPSLRRAFRQAWIEAERTGAPPPPSPFGVGGRQPSQPSQPGGPGRVTEFLRWATEPATPEQRRAGLHRWAMSVWQARPDLRLAFPDPLGEHAEGFRDWCATSGVAEGELDPRAVPAGAGAEPVPVRDAIGANVLGYLTAELGVGELGRLVHEAVLASGVPVATAVEEHTVDNRTGHPLPDGVAAGAPQFPVSVLCVNADMTRVTLRAHPDLGRARYVIGVWSWELSQFPPSMHEAFELVDEVWTISDFCADAIAAHSPVPVHTFPVPVRAPSFRADGPSARSDRADGPSAGSDRANGPSARADRADGPSAGSDRANGPSARADRANGPSAGNDRADGPWAGNGRGNGGAGTGAGGAGPGEGRPVFLFVFDHNSVFDRKNPMAAVAAFQRAFPGRPAGAPDAPAGARLVIKSINGDKHPADRERLRAAAAGDGRIELIEGYLDAGEVHKLYASADCYLSLHRSEGFGLTVAEAMAHGLPVIATGYGGTGEFLTTDTGWPVPYRLVPVGPANPPYPADALWAEPDLDAAAGAMREVAGDPGLAAGRGAAARQYVLTTRSMDAAACWVRERIELAYRRWRDAAGVSSGPAPAAVTAVRTAREALRWRADVHAPSRLPLAPALRRAVLRGIDHYDQHQRAMLGALMDGVEHGLGRVSDLQAQLAERVAVLERQLADSRAEVAGLAERTTDRAEQLHAAVAELDARTRARLDGAEQALAGALTTGLNEALNEAVAGGRLASGAGIERVTAVAAGRVDDLDRKLVALLAERDARLDRAEAAAADVRRELPALRTGLLRHHDLLSPPPVTVAETVATDVGLLRLPAWDRVMLPWLRTYGGWENAESRLLAALLPAGGGFVDIGAHAGYFTVLALRIVGAGGAVFAVEPWAPARELLAGNAAANVPAGALAALTVLPIAAWDADGPLRLTLSTSGNTGDNRVDEHGTLEVTGARLDAVPELAGAQIHVVKSDAQGRDHRALAGAAGVLARCRPHVLCEFDPAAIASAGDDPAAVLRRYRSWGYQPVPVTEPLADAVAAAGPARVPCHLTCAESDDLVGLAHSAPSGFITLWLRPAEGADGG